MMIRLVCAQCNRLLKVPDAAVGKKILCPACGSKFIGDPALIRDGIAAPAAAASPPLATPVSDAVSPLAESVFGNEQPVAKAESAPPRDEVAFDFPSLELDSSRRSAAAAPEADGVDFGADQEVHLGGEPVDPHQIDLLSPQSEVVEPEVIEPEVLEPEIVEPEAMEPEVLEPEVVEAAEVEPEVVEAAEVEPVSGVESPRQRPRLPDAEMETGRTAGRAPKRSKTGLIIGCLLGMVLLALFGGVAAVAYWLIGPKPATTQVMTFRGQTGAMPPLNPPALPPFNPNPQPNPNPGRNPNPNPPPNPGPSPSTGIPAKEWNLYTPENSRCSVMMPGAPQRAASGFTPKGVAYVVKRPRENAEFHVSFFDLDRSEKDPVKALESQSDKDRDTILARQASRVSSERSFKQGQWSAREVVLQLPGRNLILRLLAVKQGNHYRVYRLMTQGPGYRSDSGDAEKFLSSFLIVSGAPRRR